MKRSIKYITLSLLAISASACDKRLDVEPTQYISSEVALSNASNIENLLIGAYQKADNEYVYGGYVQIFGDLYGTSNQLGWTGTYQQPRQVFTKRLLVDNSFVANYWLNAYSLINITNLIIDHANVIEDTERQAQVIGEAKFLRAITYFDMVRFFGDQYEAGQQNSQLGIPISLIGITDYSGDLSIARNTVEEVYTQVLSDLNDAYATLPETNDEFVNKYTAKALLARVYLQQGNYAEARDAANDVIANSGLSLTVTYTAAFNNDSNSSEDLFAIQITTQDGVNRLITHYADQPHGGRKGDIIVEDAYIDLFDSDTDVRKSFFYTSADNAERLTSKYTNQYGNIPVIRLAELYLIRAEANQRLGTAVGASPADDINTIRARSHAATKRSVTLNDILLERQLELAFEGFLIHDIKRIKGSITITENQQPVVLPYNDERLLFPIPQRETNVNPLLEQNEHYK